MTDTTIVMTKTSQKRLQRDIIDIIKHPLTEHGIYYAHDENNMLNGYAIIFGPSDTIYRHGAYYFKFEFPTNYPFSPPTLKYLTNDGNTRFHPNLYRNGKVCISILNTWKGEQWTSCQNIKSVLLMLVTLFHNKPLLNEPGISENHKAFRPYNRIITFKNIEIAIIRNLKKGPQNEPCKCFDAIYKKYIIDNKENILEYIKSIKVEGRKWHMRNAAQTKSSEKAPNYISVSLYNMSYKLNYKNMYDDALSCLSNFK